MLLAIKENINKAISYGVVHVFSVNVVNKLVAFLSNILIVRFLTQEAYGVFSYSFTFYSIAALVTGFGVLNGVFLRCSGKRPLSEINHYYSYGFLSGLGINLIICAILILIGLFFPSPIENSGFWICCLAPLVLFDYFYLFETTVFRTKKLNKDYARLMGINSVLYGLLSCVGAMVAGISGTVAGRYLAFAITIFIGAINLSKLEIQFTFNCFKQLGFEKPFWNYSLSVCLINFMTFFAITVDIILVGIITGNPSDVASYKVATLLPEGFYFVPSSAIAAILPYLVERGNDSHWVNSVTHKLILSVGGIMLLIMMMLIIFAPWIIYEIWGSGYAASVLPFQILSLTLMTTTIKLICMDVCLMLEVSSPSLGISFSSLCIDVLLIFVLTPILGITGTAWSVFVADFTAMVLSVYLFINTLKKRKEKHEC